MHVWRGHTRGCLCITFISIVILISGGKLYGQCDTQYDALMSIYNATDGDNWNRNDNWGSNCDICDWYGISCDTEGNVIRLNFYNNGLSGELPDVFSSLSFLESFDVYNCDVTGEVPTSLASLSYIIHLNLSRNNFSGSIPESFFQMPFIQNLYLNNNAFEGCLPTMMTSGNLRNLWVQHNLLSCEIPAAIGNLTALESFTFYRNDISGPIPSEIGGCTALKRISGYSNQLDGDLPSTIADLMDLEEIQLSNNIISGGLDLDWSGLQALKAVNLNNNSITESFPQGITQAINLEELRLGNNFLSGSLPFDLGNLSKLELLSLHNNSISGPIPASIEGLVACQEIDLSRNQLSGSLPPEIGSLGSLVKLKLNENGLEGELPHTMCMLTQIEELDLNRNNITGIIPSCIDEMAALRILNMSYNSLIGEPPESLGNLLNLVQIRFFSNQLTGCYPESFSSICGINLFAFEENCMNLSFQDFCNGTYCSPDSALYISSDSGHLACKDEQIILTAVTAIDGWMYDWSTGERGVNLEQISVQPISTAQYSVTVTTIEGCDYTDEIELEVIDLQTSLESPSEYCFKTEGYQMEALPIGGVWSGDHINDSGLLIPVESMHDYQVSYQYLDVSGCSVILDTTIYVFPRIQTNIQSSICDGELYEVGGEQYGETGQYEVTLTTMNGCDSIIMLDLLVYDVAEEELVVSICEGELYEVGGELYGETGQYEVILTTVNGCDSIIMLDLLVYDIAETELGVSICEGELYEVGEEVFSETGQYEVILTTVNGCDSIVILDLLVYDIAETELGISICEGELYEVGGELYGETGQYEVTLTTVNGCDSIVILDLLVYDVAETELGISICEGELYEVGGEQYGETGQYEVTLTTENGCDSIVILDLLVYDVAETELGVSICEGEQYEVGGELYGETGQYEVTLSTVNGCDSVVTLDLLVYEVMETEIAASICEGEQYEVGGEVFSETGQYEVILTTAEGCDSIVSLDLTVKEHTHMGVSVSICEGEFYQVGNQIFSEAGEYSINLQTGIGCDSIIFLSLSIQEPKVTDIIETVCSGEIYEVGEEVIDETGEYQFVLESSTGCDSIVNLDITIFPDYEIYTEFQICENTPLVLGGEEYYQPGSYDVTLLTSTGCDSVIVFDLIVNPEFQTSLTEELCPGESITIGNETYDENGVYNIHLTSTSGCDSVIILDLSILQRENEYLEATICSSDTVELNGISFTETGLYTIQVDDGACGSTITLDLTVYQMDHTHIDTTLCYGGSLGYLSDEITEEGLYFYTLTNRYGCDSLIELQVHQSPIIEHFVSSAICPGDTIYFGNSILTEAGEYDEVFKTMDGCDSLVHLFLLLLEGDDVFTNAEICRGDVYDFYGTLLSETGTYQTVVESESGCISTINLDLQILEGDHIVSDTVMCIGEPITIDGNTWNEPGSYVYYEIGSNGCNDTLVVNITGITPDTIYIERQLCEGESYEYNGIFYSEPGIFLLEEESNECLQITLISISVFEISDHEESYIICDGEEMIFLGDTLSEEGVYIYQLTSMNGCDSMVTLNISYLPTYVLDTAVNLCQGGILMMFGDTISSEGIYEYTTSSTAGCDSVINLIVNLNPPEEIFSSVSLCNGETYTVQGIDYTFPTTVKSVYKDPGGCDVIEFIELNFLPPVSSEMEIDICEGDSYELLGQEFSESGYYKVITQNQAGCDSIINVAITVIPGQSSIIYEEICNGDSIVYNMQTFYETGSYSFIYQNQEGCDSIVWLNILVIDEMDETIEASICQGESYYFAGESYSNPGSYEILLTNGSCTERVNLQLTIESSPEIEIEASICPGDIYQWREYTFDAPGSYNVILPNQEGCDTSVIVLVNSYSIDEYEIVGDTTGCHGDEVVLSIEAEGEIEWNNGKTSSTITVDQSGEYHVTITDENGCTSSIHHQLDLKPVPEVIHTTIQHPYDCNPREGKITLATDIEALFSIDGGSTFTERFFFDSLVAGSYEIHIATSNFLCYNEEPVLIELIEKSSITIDSLNYADGTSCTEPSGVISIFANSDLGVLEYSLDQGVSWQDIGEFSELDSDIYQPWIRVMGTECVQKAPSEILISEPTTLQLSTEIIQEPECIGDSNGIARLIIDAEDQVENILWPDGQNEMTATNLEPGTHPVLVTSVDGCESWINVEMSEPHAIPYERTFGLDTSICLGSAFIIPNSSEGLLVSWYNEAGFIAEGDSIIIIEEGMLYMEISDGRSCFLEDSIYVSIIEEDHQGIDFLLSSEGLLGSPMVIVDVSWPMVENVTWEFQDSEIVIHDIMDNQVIVEFPDTGIYEVTMHVDIGVCPFSITKQTRIVSNESQLNNPDPYEGLGASIQEFRVFPNPNDGNFSARIGLKKEGSVLVTIVSSMGRMVHQQTLHNENLYAIMMDITDEPPGIYTIIVQTERESRYLSFSKN